MKKRLVDIYVEDEKDRNTRPKEEGGSGRMSSRRSTYSARQLSRRSNAFRLLDILKYKQFCREVEEAYRREEGLSSHSSRDNFDGRIKEAESARWWPKKSFLHEEILSPPMSKKKLRNLGYLSHSVFPRVNENLKPIDSDDKESPRLKIQKVKK